MHKRLTDAKHHISLPLGPLVYETKFHQLKYSTRAAIQTPKRGKSLGCLAIFNGQARVLRTSNWKVALYRLRRYLGYDPAVKFMSHTNPVWTHLCGLLEIFIRRVASNILYNHYYFRLAKIVADLLYMNRFSKLYRLLKKLKLSPKPKARRSKIKKPKQELFTEVKGEPETSTLSPPSQTDIETCTTYFKYIAPGQDMKLSTDIEPEIPKESPVDEQEEEFRRTLIEMGLSPDEIMGDTPVEFSGSDRSFSESEEY